MLCLAMNLRPTVKKYAAGYKEFMFDFDTPINRENTHCEKYDGRLNKFGKADVLPLWVADMDFTAPPCVLQAVKQRLQHGVLGYSYAPESLYESLIAWFSRHHQWSLARQEILLTTGVVPSLFSSVQALTNKGDKVLVPTPVYPPFFYAITNNERELVEVPLLEAQQGYQLDWDLLEREAKTASMLLLCNPHNPVGRVWTQQEFQQLIDLALRHNLVLVSDDIHCDMVYPNFKYLPLASLAPKELRLITLISPSKTFNIPGLNLSALVANHEADRQAIRQVFSRLSMNPFNPLNMAAFEAAYGQGEEWLNALKHYLYGNAQYVLEQLTHTPIQCRMPEATVLLWLDCRKLGMSDKQLREFFTERAGLGLNDGLSFGAGGSGFMRLNIATQKARLQQAMPQLQQALIGIV